MKTNYDLIVIGGGAAGFFGAITAKAVNPNMSVLLLEKSGALLSKVKVSGGGRCNVTHACFDPIQLAKNYPRGGKELIGPFHRFQPRDTVDWFESRRVKLKAEEDGRMFPITDSSQTIIDCLMAEARKLKVEIHTLQRLESVELKDGKFAIKLTKGDTLECNYLLLATGSSPQGHEIARSLGHSIQETVPSLFTFNVPNSPMKGLEGIAVEEANVQILDSPYTQKGPVLITHWGFSGPAALKLSAWGARFLHSKNYKVAISINWLPKISKASLQETLRKIRKENPSQMLTTANPFALPKNLWRRLLELEQLETKRFSDMSNDGIEKLSNRLNGDIYEVDGKTTYKEEFVTCGGVTLSEVDFKTMQSKICPKLYFAGEVLDIDAITGGFNFQNAWTTAWIAGNSMEKF